MTKHPHPGDLADLRATVATLQGEVRRLQRRRRLPRRALPLIMAALLVALVPLATLAANPFGDLNPNSPHNGNIDLIYNAGITTGCDPNVSYCPSGNVTREEMASFLARTAGLGTNPPVVNAKTAQTATSAQNAVNAQNAAALGGQPSSAYQRADQPIANANNAALLNGLSANSLVRVASGTTVANPINELTGNFEPLLTVTIDAPQSGFVLVNATANLSPTQAGYIMVRLRHVESTFTSYAPTVTTSNGDIVVPFTWVFAVSAGTQTFTFDARKLAPGQVLVPTGTSALTAMYVPFNGTGGR